MSFKSGWWRHLMALGLSEHIVTKEPVGKDICHYLVRCNIANNMINMGRCNSMIGIIEVYCENT